MNIRHFLAAALIAPLAVLAGCTDTEPEQNVEEAVGIDEGTETSTSDLDQKQFIVTNEKTIEDAETGEIVSKEVEKTPVTVTKERKVEDEINVEAGDTSKESTGLAPEGIDDN